MTQQIRTVTIKGKQYIDVAERCRLCNADEGFSMLREEASEIAGTHILRVYIEVKGKQYIGDAEIKVNAKPGTADGDSPISCAQTSALGRALGFAGYGSLDSIASADEVARNEQQHSARKPTPEQMEQIAKGCKAVKRPAPTDIDTYEQADALLRELDEAYRAKAGAVA